MKKISFLMKLAGLYVKIDCKYEDCRKLCEDYIVPEDGQAETQLEITASDADIRRECSLQPDMKEGYVETICIYRHIAEQIPKWNRMVVHGAAISYRGKAYLFTAPSGTGKTTHIGLWRKYLGKEVDIINGDKPILHVEENRVTVYGTPWSGKEHWQKNRSMPLEGICVLRQARENHIRRLDAAESVNRMMPQIYMPKTMGGAEKTLELMDCLLTRIPVWILDCDISEEAVSVCRQALTGGQ